MKDMTAEDGVNLAAIVAKDLFKVFPKTKVPSVKNLSFEIQQGEAVAFLGQNGAGKSTTLKILCGILTPTTGNALVLGEKAGSIEANKSLGLVFGTRSQLYQHMSVLECLHLMAEIYFVQGALKKQRIEELTELFGIGAFLKRRVRTLSLGERMRCEVVSALIHRPKILLADEPTIGLDVIAKNSLREVIQRWQKSEQTTLMLTSHDLSDVEALCSRCILIDQGEKKYDGPLNELKGRLQNLRRVQVLTTQSHYTLYGENLNSSETQGEQCFQSAKVINSYTHVYEFFTNRFPVSEVLFTLSKHYGNSLQDITIGEITLEEVLKERYAKL